MLALVAWSCFTPWVMASEQSPSQQEPRSKGLRRAEPFGGDFSPAKRGVCNVG